MAALKKVSKWLIPGVVRSEDGREKWPSRPAFILASMGVAVGLGNLLRYPSIVFKNNGLQWFIPYFMALLFIGIPLLMLEIATGQAYRGGSVVALGRISRRLRGLGLTTVYVGYTVGVYYVVILAWVLVYLRNSFISPLPWKNTDVSFFVENVHRNPDPIKSENGFIKHPQTAVVGENIGWTMFVWALVYFCIFKGVSLTGRIVYFSMLVPIATLIIIMVRAVTLENAAQGVRYYVGEWNGEKLASGTIWKDAVSQIFFSLGLGSGTFAAYASYNSKFANAVQDTLIIATCNSLYEIVAGFAAFGVIGFLGIKPDGNEIQGESISGSYQVAFVTYPQAIARLPGSNAWAVIFFSTLLLLGIDTAFALMEGFVTVVIDTDWGKKLPRPAVTGIIIGAAALFSIMFTTQFGYYLLDAVDLWLADITLVGAMWMQCATVTTIYRYRDTVSQVGYPAFMVANITYVAGQILAVLLWHTVSATVGLSVGAGIILVGTVAAVLISKKPDIAGWWGMNKYANSLWWLTCYSGHQLSLDLNAIIARGKNWSIPLVWAPLLRWFSGPALMVILGFGYAAFPELANDPVHIFGFAVAHVAIVFLAVGYIFPRSINVWVSEAEMDKHEEQYAKGPRETLEEEDIAPEKAAADANIGTEKSGEMELA